MKFSLTADASATEFDVKGSVSFRALQDFGAGSEFRAYVVILEDTVLLDDQLNKYQANNFSNIMRKLLPEGAGQFVELLSGQSIATGEYLMVGSSDDLDGGPQLR